MKRAPLTAVLIGALSALTVPIYGQFQYPTNGPVFLNNYDSNKGIYLGGVPTPAPVGTLAQVLGGPTPAAVIPLWIGSGMTNIFAVRSDGVEVNGPGTGSFFDGGYGYVPGVGSRGVGSFQVIAWLGASNYLKAQTTLHAWSGATPVWSQTTGTPIDCWLPSCMDFPAPLLMPSRIVLGETVLRPLFITQPAAQDAWSGESVTFTVGVACAVPFAYQWLLNGMNLPGATNAALILPDTQTSDSGIYSVVVSNANGSATSSNALLRVSDSPPLILVQPKDQVTTPIGSAAFQVVGGGSLPQWYQWRFDGVDLPGETNVALALQQPALAQTGNYSVLISNLFGTVTSSNAQLVVVSVVGWGYGDYGQTVILASQTNVVAVAAGGYPSLALRSDETVLGWGYGAGGGLTNAVEVAAGEMYTLALKSDGTVTGWGADQFGRIIVPTNLPIVVAIAAGDSHSLALTGDGKVIAWGRNNSGQTNVPADLTGVVAIAAGGDHSLALKDDGRVIGWGNDLSGQSTAPPGLSNVVAIAAGTLHTLALTSEGTVVAWGSNNYGQTNVPAGLTNVVAIAAGGDHNLALTGAGKLLAWGYNGFGETNVPPALANVVAIACGDDYNLAVVGTVPPPPPILVPRQLSEPTRIPAGFSVALPTDIGRRYLLQYKNALSDSNWTSLFMALGDGGVKTLADPTATPAQRFYRVRQLR